jgi:hypothetical protein
MILDLIAPGDIKSEIISGQRDRGGHEPRNQSPFLDSWRG